jgi:hypothetical protein
VSTIEDKITSVGQYKSFPAHNSGKIVIKQISTYISKDFSGSSA